MNMTARIVGGLIAVIVVFAIVQTLASERIEVVELGTTDEQGETVNTRLWIVDYQGHQYLRVGGSGSGWYSRIQANDQIIVTRRGQTARYTSVARPELSDEINALMRSKYTWGDSFFAAVFGSRDGSIPIELRPVVTGQSAR